MRELLAGFVAILDDDVESGRIDLDDDQVGLVAVQGVRDPRDLVGEREVHEAVLCKGGRHVLASCNRLGPGPPIDNVEELHPPSVA